MNGKLSDRHGKMSDYMTSEQLKRIESEQAELLKTLDRHLAELKCHLAQYKTVSAEREYQCFFETYDEL